LSVKPVNLVEHVLHHRVGELFWWIAHGIPATPMPGFASQMSAAEIWDLIQFLSAQSEAEDATALISRVESWRPIVAPDFTFQVAARTQESLQQQRGRYIALVVFYTLPQSLPRLRALAAERSALEQAGARAIVRGTRACALKSGFARRPNRHSHVLDNDRDLERPSTGKGEGQREPVALLERLSEIEQHEVVAAGLQVELLAGFQIHRRDRAHFHYPCLHRHLVQLDGAGDRR
jgi:hypothetical protein